MSNDSGISSFVSRDDTTRDIEECIVNQKRDRSTSFSSDRMTECPRRLVYESLNYDRKENPLDISHVKTKWIERLSKVKNVSVVKVKVLASDCNYNIVDTIDGIIRYKDDELFVINVQPVSSHEFSIINKKGALRKHVVTIITQMWLVEIKNGLLIYENKDDNSFVIFRVKEYKSIILSVQKKCKLMMEYKIKGLLPERPYQKNIGSECNECEFAEKCWKK